MSSVNSKLRRTLQDAFCHTETTGPCTTPWPETRSALHEQPPATASPGSCRPERCQETGLSEQEAAAGAQYTGSERTEVAANPSAADTPCPHTPGLLWKQRPESLMPPWLRPCAWRHGTTRKRYARRWPPTQACGRAGTRQGQEISPRTVHASLGRHHRSHKDACMKGPRQGEERRIDAMEEGIFDAMGLRGSSAKPDEYGIVSMGKRKLASSLFSLPLSS